MSDGLVGPTRVVVNGTPEPVSNMVVSTAEDVAVIGGVALTRSEPELFAGLCVSSSLPPRHHDPEDRPASGGLRLAGLEQPIR